MHVLHYIAGFMRVKKSGTFILRIEDTDLERSTPESVQAILDGMALVESWIMMKVHFIKPNDLIVIVK